MKKNNGLIIGIIIGVIVIGVILFCILGNIAKPIQNVDYTQSIDTNNNNPTENTENKTPIQNIVNSVISNEFSGDIKNILPTINDFDNGYEVSLDKDKNIDSWKTEDKTKALNRGYQQGYYRDFEKGSGSVFDLENYDSVQFNVSVYSKDYINEILQEDISLIEKGEKTAVDDDNEEIIYLYNQLKDPKIGDKSIMWSSHMDGFGLKKYTISFIKKNVYVSVTCFSGDTQNAIDNCIDWAKFVERKI